jgi:hypothetical protein
MKVHFIPFFDLFLEVLLTFLLELLEFGLEEISHQHSDHIQSFLAIMITVILPTTTQHGSAQSLHHIPNEKPFLGFIVVLQMGQQFLLQNLSPVLDTHFLLSGSIIGSLGNEIQCEVRRVSLTAHFVKTGLQQFDHRLVLQIVTHHLENFLISGET